VFRLMLYQRALHPELFDLQARRRDRQGEYEVESWVTPAGHVVRFQVGQYCLTECVIDRGDHLPETGLAYALPCLGEKDYELDDPATAGGKLGYVTTIQTENLTDNLYQATFREMQDFVSDTGSLAHEWKTADGLSCLSLLDAQKYRREFHVQSYHLLGVNGLVLRTQSIFEMR
jgi:hypothetical protein